MQTFTEQFYVNKKTFALVSQFLFPDINASSTSFYLANFHCLSQPICFVYSCYANGVQLFQLFIFIMIDTWWIELA